MPPRDEMNTNPQVPGMIEDDVKAALSAMMSNKSGAIVSKTQIPDAGDDEEDDFFG